MEKNKLFILSLQCTMFFDALIPLDKNSKIDLLTKVTGKLGTLLDGEPTLLPVPQDAPPDIPRLQLSSKDNSYAYGISLIRSDFTFNQRGEPNKGIGEVCAQLFAGEKEILKIYRELMNWGIGRLGMVANYVTELEDSASSFISSKFLVNNPRYNSIELGLLKKDELDKFHINRWLRIKNIR